MSSDFIEKFTKAQTEITEYFDNMANHVVSDLATVVGSVMEDGIDYEKLATDASSSANLVFPAKTVHTPATQLVLTQAYDMAQANTRAASVYTMGRADFYAQAIGSMENRVRRIKSVQSTVLNTLKHSEKPIAAQMRNTENY